MEREAWVWDRQKKTAGQRGRVREGELDMQQYRVRSGGGKGETSSDGKVCAGVRGLIQRGGGGTDGTQYVRPALRFTISVMARMADLILR